MTLCARLSVSSPFRGLHFFILPLLCCFCVVQILAAGNEQVQRRCLGEAAGLLPRARCTLNHIILREVTVANSTTKDSTDV